MLFILEAAKIRFPIFKEIEQKFSFGERGISSNKILTINI